MVKVPCAYLTSNKARITNVLESRLIMSGERYLYSPYTPSRLAERQLFFTNTVMEVSSSVKFLY